MNQLALGELSRAVLIAIGVVLAAFATAAAGPISFIALVGPQLARRLVPGGVSGLIASASIGALLVVASDLLAREVFAPTALSVGVMTAFLGAPYLLYLLVRR